MEIIHVPISEVAGKIRKIPLDSSLIKTALALDTCLGVPDEVLLKEEEVIG
jgi:hypothetical protein